MERTSVDLELGPKFCRHVQLLLRRAALAQKCWLTSMAAAGAAEPSWLDSLIPSDASAGRYVYLVSFSRLLPETLVGAQGGLRSLDELTRAEAAEFVREAFDNPAVNETDGGRPRVRDTPLVRKVVPAAGEPPAVADDVTTDDADTVGDLPQLLDRSPTTCHPCSAGS